MKRFSVWLVAALTLVMALPFKAQDAPLEIVASTPFIADVVRQVGGDNVNVTSIVPMGADLHAFVPTPSDIVRLVEADLVFVNGAGLEEWLGDVIQENASIEPVVVSMGVPMLGFEGHSHDHEHMDDDHMDDEHMDDEHMGDDHGGMMGGTVSAAYMSITNNGTSDVTLNAASAAFANVVEIHETTIDDDVARMREIGEIVIPAGETVTLAPGGLHIMLIGITEDLMLDDTAMLTLGFDDGTTLDLEVVINDIPPEEPRTTTINDLVITQYWARPAAAMSMDMGDDHDHDHMGDDHDHDHMGDDHDHGAYLGRLGEIDCEADGHDDHDDHDHMGDDHHDHNHGPCDPHVWTNPANVMIWADNIANALAGADEAHAETYFANAEAYKAQLAELDEVLHAGYEAIPAENRIIVTNHDFLGYFAEHYGFEIVGVVFGATTLAEPSAQDVAALVEVIRETGVRAIFTETSAPDALSSAIASEVGSDVQVVTLYSGTLDEAVPTYIDYLLYNFEAITGALGE